MYPEVVNQFTKRSWGWATLLVLTVVAASFPVSLLVGQISRHRSIWFLTDIPSGKGFERPLAKELCKEWSEVGPDFRRSWILVRTPISLYMAVLMTCLGPACCLAGHWKWHRGAWFIALGLVTLAHAAFHVWARNPWANLHHIVYWPFGLFPASLLLLIWMFLLIQEWSIRRKARQLTVMN